MSNPTSSQNGGGGGGSSSTGVTSIIGMLLGSWLLPGNNAVLNTLIGLAIGTALEYTFGSTRAWFSTTNAYRALSSLWAYRYRLVVTTGWPGDTRYVGVSNYVLENYVSNLRTCTYAKDTFGGCELSLLHERAVAKQIFDTFEQHRISIEIVDEDGGAKSTNEHLNDVSAKPPTFAFQSQTADLHVLERYVTHICTQRIATTKQHITLHTANVTFDSDTNGSGGGGSSNDNNKTTKCAWTLQRHVCAKMLKNTQVHRDVERAFFNDIAEFIERRAWYDERGLVHQRGYFLHSPPGCGKTAMLKAVAHAHRLEIFSIDLSVVRTSAALTSLAGLMRGQLLNSERTHILAFEDIDRCEALLETPGDGDCATAAAADVVAAKTTTSKISMTTLLNIIDGLGAPTSRIVVMTANDSKIVERHRALVRPGRVDVTIAIPYVDDDQLQRMMRVYFDKFDVESLFCKRHNSAQRLADAVFGDDDDTDSDDDDDENPGAQYRLSVEPLLVSTMVVAQVQANPDAPLRALEALTRIVAC